MMHRSSSLQVIQQMTTARFAWKHPLYLIHALTARCNARCGFCAWNPDFYNPRDQLSTDLIKKLYRDAREEGFIGLSVWGGEPLLHPDFDELIQYAHDLGLMTNLVTNGFLLERKLHSVMPYVDRISISVDHPSAQHDEMRGIKGLFDRILSATREIQRRDMGKTVLWVVTLQKANIDPRTIRELAELMVRMRVLGVFNALREEAATDETDICLSDYAPSQEELTSAFETLIDLKQKGYPILNSYTHMNMLAKGPPKYRCHWPKFMLPVEANGDVVDCMHWGTRPLGNLRDLALRDFLQSERLRALAGSEGEQCHRCVSIHRVELSEVGEGNMEPVFSWGMLKHPPGHPADMSATV